MSDIITAFAYLQVIHGVFPDVDISLTRNYGMLNNNVISLYKNSAQTVLLEVRSLSRKLLSVGDRDFYINIIDSGRGVLMYRRLATVLDPTKGRLKFYFSSSDLDDIKIGMYSFSISSTDYIGEETFLFLDQVGGATGTVEIIDKTMPAFVPSIVANVFQRRIDNNANLLSGYYTSSKYPGAGQNSFTDGQHTIGVYCTNFTGQFFVQGSLADQPDEPDWFNLIITEDEMFNFVGFTGIESFNFYGPLLWVRFLFVPDPALNEGTLDQILYRGINDPLPSNVTGPLVKDLEHQDKLRRHGENPYAIYTTIQR